MLCHNCKTEMQQTKISTLKPEQTDKIIGFLDSEHFFPQVIHYINESRDLKINLIEKGYNLFLCPKDRYFILEKKHKNFKSKIKMMVFKKC